MVTNIRRDKELKAQATEPFIDMGLTLILELVDNILVYKRALISNAK